MRVTQGIPNLAILLSCLIFGIDGFVPSSRTTPFSQSKNLNGVTNIPSKIFLQDSMSHQVANRIGFRNRLKKTWKQVFTSRIAPKQKLRRRTLLVGVASVLSTLLVRPAITLAMGAMGGTKGPVAPMER
eukprot:scaffold10201_cov119-Cylindrotheca_fusiformis.AAC.11